MSVKLEKIAAERDKCRRKRDEWDERMKEWDRKYQEQENSEICDMVHSLQLTPDQLAELLKIARTGAPDPEKLPDDFNTEMEDNRI